MSGRTTIDDRLADWLAEGPGHAPSGLLKEKFSIPSSGMAAPQCGHG